MRTIAYGEYIALGGGLKAQVKRALDNVNPNQTAKTLIAAVPGKKIRVLALAMNCDDAPTSSVFLTKPAGAGTPISCRFVNAANGGAVLNFNPAGWFETGPGEALTVTTGAGSNTGYQIVYIEVPA
ncbi:MAG TPA: hypothetical protein PK184_18460 [Phycisphaerae bacterium]|nr:hypothetical protein [Phycisphaerae bacterium]